MIKKQFIKGAKFYKRKIRAAVVKDHHLMNHGQFQMGCRIIYWYPRIFCQQNNKKGNNYKDATNKKANSSKNLPTTGRISPKKQGNRKRKVPVTPTHGRKRTKNPT